MSRLLAAIALAVALTAGPASAQEQHVTLASTTSTENSGLFRDILPKFTAKTGIGVRVVAVGTGAALRLGRDGDADVLLVHARDAEEAFVAAGHGLSRQDVMFNDFIIAGPTNDPAKVRGLTEAPAALARIADAKANFLSRGDDSGTHRAERRLWKTAGRDPDAHSGRWYKETGAGMGATLNTAAVMGAYVLTDRGTWLSFRNRDGLAVLVEGDPALFNQYGVIPVNPARHPHVKADLAARFVGWLTGPQGQRAIAAFRVGGEQLFFPNALPADG